MNFTYKIATIEDLEVLTKTRIEVLRAANQLDDDVDMSLVEKESRVYCQNALTAAKDRGITHITLEATEMGRTLYEKYGFMAMQDEMQLPE